MHAASLDRLLRAPWARRSLVLACALGALVLRLLGAAGPVGADEAGFLIVARTWDPRPDSLYGHHFVDRPPLLLMVFRYVGAIDGVTSVRVLGAVACALVVLTAAATARLVAGNRAQVWVAAFTAAATTHPMIDPVDVKGELLGLPFVTGACFLALLALRRESVPLAFLAGVSASLAAGFKQNLLGALVFAGVLLLASGVSGRISPRTCARLSAAGLVGVLLHPAATALWAWWAGVGLDTLWYTVFEFRMDAGDVLSARESPASQSRAQSLLLVALLSGVAVVLVVFLATLRRQWRMHSALTAAIGAMAAYDVWAMASGGSFWRDYLFALVPVAALAASAVIGSLEHGSLLIPVVVAGAGVTALAAIVSWVLASPGWVASIHEDDTGEAIAAVSRPGDTLTVFGGHASIQLRSDLPSPYRHLWSLPMRTLDPELAELRSLVAGPDAPTWLVEVAHFEVWQPDGGAKLREVVEDRYVVHEPECGAAQRIWRLREAPREVPQPTC